MSSRTSWRICAPFIHKRGSSMVTITRILCPIDFSPASTRAADYAAKLASDPDARLMLLHVIPPLISPAQEFPISDGSVAASIEEGSRRQLDKLVKTLPPIGND